MHKKFYNLIVLLFTSILIFNSNIVVNFVDNASAESNTLFVGGSGLDNYDTIQDAVDDAAEGDEIFIYNGVYTENVVVDKSISIVGENRVSTIVDGGLISDVFDINSDNVIISNITIRKSGINFENDSITFAGIYCENSSYFEIYNSVITDCHIGIIFVNSIGNVIDNCIFDANAGGINLFNTSDSFISNCTIIDHYRLWGLSLQRADDNIISYCNISKNMDFGLAMTQSDSNSFFNNNFLENENAVLVALTSFEPCEFNVFYSNNFIDSAIINVRDYCENEFWDDGLKGNYWSEFDEPIEGAWDNDSDGIVDSAFDIIPTSAGNRDNYPLYNPVDIEVDKPEINYPPKISNIIPANNALSLSVSTSTLSVYIEDDEMDLFSWSIETSPDVGSSSGSNEVDGIKTCSISDLEYDTTYVWFVNVTDEDGSGIYLRESYIFTTESGSDDSNGTPGFELFWFLFVIIFFIVFRKRFLK